MKPTLIALALIAGAAPASAEQLYNGDNWAAVASDNRAASVGDVITVLISETASATNRVRNNSSKETSLSGGFSAGSIDESASLGLRGSYNGSGQVERSDRFVARMAAQVVAVLPNGDFLIEGRQNLFINGEERSIGVRGQIRPIDITSDNSITSSRLANAEINYDGKGWATRSAKPGLINRIFSFLGIG